LGGGLSTGFIIENNTVINSFNGVWTMISNSLIQNNNFSNNIAGIDIVETENTIKGNNTENNSVVGPSNPTTLIQL